MSIKTKNEEDASLLKRFQQFIGHGKTLQLIIDASPSECLTWMESLKGKSGFTKEAP